MSTVTATSDTEGFTIQLEVDVDSVDVETGLEYAAAAVAGWLTRTYPRLTGQQLADWSADYDRAVEAIGAGEQIDLQATPYGEMRDDATEIAIQAAREAWRDPGADVMIIVEIRPANQP